MSAFRTLLSLSCTFILLLALALPGAWAGTVTVGGTGACQDLLRSLGADYSRSHPGVTVDVPDSIGSSGGVKAAAEGKVELGRVARKLKETEKAYGLVYVPFASMPVVFACNPSLPVMDITPAQAYDIFTGKLSNWSQVGGPDARIRVISRPATDSSLLVLKEGLAGWSGIELTTRSKLASTDQEALEFIKGIEGAVGFGAYNQARGAGLTVLKLGGVSPAEDAYPVGMEFGLVYKPELLKGEARAFMEYLSTPAAAGVMKKEAAIQVKP